ncbi:OB-fold domain-containing protein [Micromonospora sp. NPDC006766]|uniref:Zn-ribbon domain-containing OB-fold protein n=1 Tax=Micromonospora sp. NPDC006766 TaxID=3154778 RepID=UPI0033E4092B
MTTSQQVPVADELFEVSVDGAAALVGSRCTGCGTHYFPKSLSCRNPRCETKRVEEVLLGRHGTLYSYTVQGYRPPALFGMDPWTPYAIGLVQLPEGLRVLGMLTGCDLDEIRIGMPLRLLAEPLYRATDGREVLTYKFSPLHEEETS